MSTKKTTKKTTASKAPSKKATKKASATRAAGTDVAGTLRLPKVGEKLTRTFRGKEHVVEVTADGFRHNGHDYTSLTAAALAITGYKAISGPAFFGLWKRAEVE
jgi:hypothetical protein